MKAFVQWLLSFPCVFLIWTLVAVPLDENLRANEFLWVGDGNTSSPYYSFLTQQQQAIDISTYPFQRGSSYVFMAWGVSQDHPFMIGEQNGDNNSSLVYVFPAHLGGTPAPLTYQNGNLAITIPSDYNGDLVYFSTSDSSVHYHLKIVDPPGGNYQSSGGGYQTPSGGYQSGSGGYQSSGSSYQPVYDLNDTHLSSLAVSVGLSFPGKYSFFNRTNSSGSPEIRIELMIESNGQFQSDTSLGYYVAKPNLFPTIPHLYDYLGSINLSPINGYKPPGVAYQSSSSGYESGGSGYQSGGSGYQSGGSGYQSSGTGYQSPGSGYQSGGSGYQSGGSGYQSGGSVYQSPGSGYQSPGSGHQYPGAGHQSPGTGYQSPGTGYQSQGNGYQSSGFGYHLSYVRTVGHQIIQPAVLLTGELLDQNISTGHPIEVGFLVSPSMHMYPNDPLIQKVSAQRENSGTFSSSFQPDSHQVLYFRGYAQSMGQTTLGNIRKISIEGILNEQNQTPHQKALSVLTADSAQENGGWSRNSWFGLFKNFNNGWIYHSVHGWLYLVSDNFNGIWAWSETRGWIWSDKEVYPFLYQSNIGNWIYLLPTKNGETRYYNYSTNLHEKVLP